MKKGLYGLMAEFEQPEDLIRAAHRAHEAGYRKMDAYTPFPIEEVSEAVGHHHTILPWIVLGGGIFGCVSGFMLQYWVSVIAYPINVGGRPFNSWPSFIPVTFEMTVLFAALSAVFGMILLNRLPEPHHPVFNVGRFALASSNRFFLCIEAEDARYNQEETRRFLEQQNPYQISEVPK
jgi:Alternative complex III, ActD subunit